MGHMSKPKEVSGVPKVLMDYGYTRDDQGKKDKLIKYGGKPILAVKDDETGYLTANMVPRKGRIHLQSRR